jgi:hypothetical protein
VLRVNLFIAIVDSIVELINVCNIVNSSSILAIMQNMEDMITNDLDTHKDPKRDPLIQFQVGLQLKQ